MIASTKFIFNSIHHSPGKEKLHGREWTVEVGIEGTDLDERGFLFDFRTFKAIWSDEIDNRLDGKKLNDTIPNPTAENIVLWIGNIFRKNLSDDVHKRFKALHIKLDEGHRGTIWETFKLGEE